MEDEYFVHYISGDEITVEDSDGNPLSLGSGNQGNAMHLEGATIVFDADATFDRVTVMDSDNLFDDQGNNTSSSDQVSVDQDPNVRFEAEYLIELTDGDGNTYTAVGISSGNNFSNIIGIAFVDVAPPFGVELTITDTSEGAGKPSTQDVPYESLVTCFTPGAMIDTPQGPRLVEEIAAGDVVLTRDNGPQVVRFVATSEFNAAQVAAQDWLQPILVKADAFGPGVPERDMRVSPFHRFVLRGWRATALYGTSEVFAHASALCNDTHIAKDTKARNIKYLHLLFDKHEVITANGVETESFQPFTSAVSGMEAQTRDELFRIMPQLRTGDMGALAQPARRMISASEVALLRG